MLCKACNGQGPWHFFKTDLIHWRSLDNCPLCTSSGNGLVSPYILSRPWGQWLVAAVNAGAEKIWTEDKENTLVGSPNPTGEFLQNSLKIHTIPEMTYKPSILGPKRRGPTGPTLFEVQAKWVLRVPTQVAFLSARNLSAAQLSSNQAFSFNISRLRKEMLTFNT